MTARLMNETPVTPDLIVGEGKPMIGPEKCHIPFSDLTPLHPGQRLILETDPTHNKHAVFDLLDKVAKGIPLSQIAVTQVGIKVTFTQKPGAKRPGMRSFEITWPNSCSLKHDGRDLIIRKMLTDSGLEPREPAQQELAAE